MLQNTSGFVYYVSIMGITGTKSASDADIAKAVQRLKRHTDLPVAVGFGIRDAEQARAVAGQADAAVVGSAIVSRITDSLDADGKPKQGLKEHVLELVRDLAAGVRSARVAAKQSGAA